ncbi:MAG: GH25 family lysozyme [Clostridia bacterium]|nr:GH25 family lysozyme [Clostridia bacterium]
MKKLNIKSVMLIILMLSLAVVYCVISANGTETREREMYAKINALHSGDHSIDNRASGLVWDDKTQAYYYISDLDGRYQIGWVVDNNCTYFFDDDGKMVTGWMQDEQSDNKYFFDKSGCMAKNWHFISDNWYYFSPDDGHMMTGDIVQNGITYHLRDDGTLITGWAFKDYWYFFNNSGVIASGWQLINNEWYFFSRSDNKMLSDFMLEDNNINYYLSENGQMHTGWLEQKDHSSWLYFDSSGHMIKGWTRIDNEWYFFSQTDGKMHKGWLKNSDGDYYFSDDGTMAAGWTYMYDTQGWYYFDDSGKAIKGFHTIGNERYHFSNTDGRMTTGWYDENGQTYFFHENGTMAKSLNHIDGELYCFDDNGVLQVGSVEINGISYRTDNNGKIIVSNSANAPVKGIDVSQWQGSDIDWNAVKNDGVEYVMIRSNYGWTGKDKYFKQNIKNAKAAGLKVGVYLYSYATTTDEAVLEFKNLMNTIDGLSLDCPIAYDIEDKCQKDLSVKEITDIAVTFCELVESAGYQPMIYASSHYLRDGFDYSRISKYDLWVAQYNTSCDYPYRTPPDAWQYSSKGKVNGISGNVDLNWFYKHY